MTIALALYRSRAIPSGEEMGTVTAGDFEWDEAKAASNLAKHGVSFEEAAVALLADPNEVPYADGRATWSRSFSPSPPRRACCSS
jgi:hypothetical protein